MYSTCCQLLDACELCTRQTATFVHVYKTVDIMPPVVSGAGRLCIGNLFFLAALRVQDCLNKTSGSWGTWRIGDSPSGVQYYIGYSYLPRLERFAAKSHLHIQKLKIASTSYVIAPCVSGPRRALAPWMENHYLRAGGWKVPTYLATPFLSAKITHLETSRVSE